jgi:hypothetical protein
MLQEGLKPEKTQSPSSRYSGMSRTEEKTRRHALEAPNNRAAGSLKKEKRTRRQREAPKPSRRTQAAEHKQGSRGPQAQAGQSVLLKERQQGSKRARSPGSKVRSTEAAATLRA